MLAYLRFRLAAMFTFRHARDSLSARKDFAFAEPESSSTGSTSLIGTRVAGSARVSAA
jgi:hypothetical protein